MHAYIDGTYIPTHARRQIYANRKMISYERERERDLGFERIKEIMRETAEDQDRKIIDRESAVEHGITWS